jgi:penicillin-binding protein 1A
VRVTARRVPVALAVVGSMLAVLAGGAQLHYVYFDRNDLPDLGPFIRFELPSIGRIYDAKGKPLIELAREYREITGYEELPPIVRDAILAAEDKRFFSHNGIDTTKFKAPHCFRKGDRRSLSSSCAAAS